MLRYRLTSLNGSSGCSKLSEILIHRNFSQSIVETRPPSLYFKQEFSNKNHSSGNYFLPLLAVVQKVCDIAM